MSVATEQQYFSVGVLSLWKSTLVLYFSVRHLPFFFQTFMDLCNAFTQIINLYCVFWGKASVWQLFYLIVSNFNSFKNFVFHKRNFFRISLFVTCYLFFCPPVSWCNSGTENQTERWYVSLLSIYIALDLGQGIIFPKAHFKAWGWTESEILGIKWQRVIETPLWSQILVKVFGSVLNLGHSNNVWQARHVL